MARRAQWSECKRCGHSYALHVPRGAGPCTRTHFVTRKNTRHAGGVTLFRCDCPSYEGKRL